MENRPEKKTRTFETWLDTLSEVAEGVSSGDVTVEKALTLARVSDSAMKVINTAVHLAQMQHPPMMLANLIVPRSAPVIEDDQAAEMASRVRGELAVVAQELARDNHTAPRKAALMEKRRQLEARLKELVPR